MKHDSKSSEKDRAAPAQAGMGKRLLKAADLVGRLLLSLVILYGVFFCIQIVLQLRSSDETSVMKNNEAPSASLTIDNAMRDMVGGSWQFAGMPWSVSVQELAESDAMLNLQSPAPELVKLTAPQDAETDGDSLGLIMDTLEMMGAEPQEQGEAVVYSVDQANLRARAFAPKSQPRRVQYARVVQRSGNELWNFIEIVAKPSDEGMQVTQFAPLMPRAPAGQRLALRMDAQGNACGELIDLGESLVQTKQRWQQAGWRIEVFDGNDADSIPELHNTDLAEQASDAAEVWVCTRNLEVIVAVPSQSLASESQTVLLVRAPE